jgi:hypothetical protein
MLDKKGVTFVMRTDASARLGYGLLFTGSIGTLIELIDLILGKRPAIHLLSVAIFAAMTIIGIILMRHDDGVRRVGIWRYKPSYFSTAAVFGRILVAFGFLAGSTTVFDWLENRAAVDGFSIIMLTIDVLAAISGVLLLIRGDDRLNESNPGGDITSERL